MGLPPHHCKYGLALCTYAWKISGEHFEVTGSNGSGFHFGNSTVARRINSTKGSKSAGSQSSQIALGGQIDFQILIKQLGFRCDHFFIIALCEHNITRNMLWSTPTTRGWFKTFRHNEANRWYQGTLKPAAMMLKRSTGCTEAFSWAGSWNHGMARDGIHKR